MSKTKLRKPKVAYVTLLLGSGIKIVRFEKVSLFEEYLLDSTDSSSKLLSLDFQNNKVVDDDRVRGMIVKYGLCKKANSDHIQSLNFKATSCSYKAVLYLYNGKYFEYSSKTLKFLDFSFCRLFDYGMEILVKGLLQNKVALEHLDITQCHLTSDGSKWIVKYLQDPLVAKSLRYLGLAWNDLENKGFEKVCKEMKLEGLEELSLEHCGITSKGCEGFEFLLSQNRSLRILNISFNVFGDAGFAEIAKKKNIPFLRKLTKLGIGSIEITEDSCVSLSSIFAKNNVLVHLNLKNNRIGDNGMKILFETALLLEKNENQTLQFLHFGRNEMTSESMKYLSKFLSVNHSLYHLNLSSNPIKDDGLKVLFGHSNSKESKESSKEESHVSGRLKSLNISRTKISEKGMSYLVSFLISRNCNLVDLNICWNDIKGDGLTELVEKGLIGTECNQNLLKFNITHTELKKDSTEVLESLVEKKKSLASITLRWNNPLKLRLLKNYKELQSRNGANKEFFKSIENNDFDKFKELISKANIYYVTRHFDNVLYLIVLFRRVKMLQFMKSKTMFSDILKYYEMKQNETSKETYVDHVRSLIRYDKEVYHIFVYELLLFDSLILKNGNTCWKEVVLFFKELFDQSLIHEKLEKECESVLYSEKLKREEKISLLSPLLWKNVTMRAKNFSSSRKEEIVKVK